MFSFFKNLASLVKISSSADNKLSSTRLSAYAILTGVLLIVLVALGVEISSAITGLINKQTYVLSNEFIIVLGSLLTHHLALLGINKHHETKEKINGDNTRNGENTTITPEPEVK